MFCFDFFSPQLKPFASPEQPEGTGPLFPRVKVGWEGALGRDFSFRVCFAPKEMSFLRTQGTKATEEEYSAESLDGNGNETKTFENLVQTFLSDGSSAGRRRPRPSAPAGGAPAPRGGGQIDVCVLGYVFQMSRV